MNRTRRERQLDELGVLCDRGAVGRAVDLAFEHFAEFGYDDAVVELLAVVVDRLEEPHRLRRRLEELRVALR